MRAIKPECVVEVQCGGLDASNIATGIRVYAFVYVIYRYMHLGTGACV